MNSQTLINEITTEVLQTSTSPLTISDIKMGVYRHDSIKQGDYVNVMKKIEITLCAMLDKGDAKLVDGLWMIGQ